MTNLITNHSFYNSIKQHNQNVQRKNTYTSKIEIKLMATLGGSTEVEYTQNSVEIDNLAIFAVQEHNIKQVFF